MPLEDEYEQQVIDALNKVLSIPRQQLVIAMLRRYRGMIDEAIRRLDETHKT